MTEQPFIHIYQVPTASYARADNCPTCGSVQPFCVTLFGGYCGGVGLTCLTCGEEWMDGCRCERPLARYWRRDSIARAKKKLESAVTREEAFKLTEYEVIE